MSLRGAIATWQSHACLSKRVGLPRYARNDMFFRTAKGMIFFDHALCSYTLYLLINISICNTPV
jgi:hypothetical protein